jgi:hypothetical protein
MVVSMAGASGVRFAPYDTSQTAAHYAVQTTHRRSRSERPKGASGPSDDQNERSE